VTTAVVEAVELVDARPRSRSCPAAQAALQAWNVVSTSRSCVAVPRAHVQLRAAAVSCRTSCSCGSPRTATQHRSSAESALLRSVLVISRRRSSMQPPRRLMTAWWMLRLRDFSRRRVSPRKPGATDLETRCFHVVSDRRYPSRCSPPSCSCARRWSGQERAVGAKEWVWTHWPTSVGGELAAGDGTHVAVGIAAGRARLFGVHCGAGLQPRLHSLTVASLHGDVVLIAVLRRCSPPS